MAITNKEVALSIIHYLKEAVSSKEVAEDYAESMDVAIDCIADAFEIKSEDNAKVVDSIFGGKNLRQILSESARESSKVPATGAGTVDQDTKKKADALKDEGNRAMAARDFDLAIKKYSEAIDLDSNNAIYLSNRAAAYSSLSQHEKAVSDAEAAIDLNPDFSKAYSRLGLAKYALGDAKAAMEAYEKGLQIEGDNKSSAMEKGYETAKHRVEEELEKSMLSSSVANDSKRENSDAGTSAGVGAGDGGFPNFGAGGMPSFSEMMNNPQLMQAAQNLMSNPGALQNLMSNPALKQMAESFTGGGAGGDGSTPNLSDLMNNPMLQNLASQFMGGGNSNSNNNQGSLNGD